MPDLNQKGGETGGMGGGTVGAGQFVRGKYVPLRGTGGGKSVFVCVGEGFDICLFTYFKCFAVWYKIR